ncbi:UTP--glucose-1-phosphate uridylyltransferase, partial [Araneus ventricosus]
MSDCTRIPQIDCSVYGLVTQYCQNILTAMGHGQDQIAQLLLWDCLPFLLQSKFRLKKCCGRLWTNFGKQRKISDSTEFKQLTKQDAKNELAKELEKILNTAPSTVEKQRTAEEFKGFQRLFSQFLQGTSSTVQWEKVEPLPEGAVIGYKSLSSPETKKIKEMLSKLVVVKLNGGLGTTMGCTGPKSIIPVRNELTFLDLTVQQIEHLNKTYDTDVPLVLMNSFNTDEDTHKVLPKYRGLRMKIYTFNQSRYPRLNKESLLPI